MNHKVQTTENCSGCGTMPRLTGHAYCSHCLLAATGLGPMTGGLYRHDVLERKIGAYTVESQIGEGGFAEVYSGTTPDGSVVAIKVLKEGVVSREVAKRFLAEQRVLRALSHPRIVRVMDSGETEHGRAFFVMEQVDGLPITEHCLVENLPLRRRAELFAEVCDAVHHAHQKGVIHRDLKPSNILVADDGPKVIDFGIAKVLEDDGAAGNTLVTRLGQVMGTPAYMSPEQAAGGDDADIRSDVYSLGAVFFEMLTGRAPFDPADFQSRPPAAWATYLLNTDTGAPSTRIIPAGVITNRALRGDLDAIVLKAMSREPERRYGSVLEFANDVRRWLTGGVVVARPPSLIYQLKRIARRHKFATAIFLALAAALVTAMISGFLLARQSQRAEAAMAEERNHAQAAEHTAERAQNRAEREAYQASIHLARLQLENGEPYLAAERLFATKPALRSWEWGHLLSATPQPDAAVDSGMADASQIAASRDGGTVIVWDKNTACLLDMSAREGRIVRRFDVPGTAAAALSPDGKLIALVIQAGRLRVIQRDGTAAWEIAFAANGASLAWEPGESGALIAVNGNSETEPGNLFRLDRSSGKTLAERQLARVKVAGEGVAVSDSGRIAVVRTRFSALKIVSLPTLESVNKVSSSDSERIADFRIEEGDEKLLIAVTHRVMEASLSTGEMKQLVRLSIPEVRPAAFTVQRVSRTKDGSVLAIADGYEGTADSAPQPRPRSAARAIAAISGSRHVALLADGRVELRPDSRAVPKKTLPTTPFYVGPEGRAVTWTADSETLAGQGWDRAAIVIGSPFASKETYRADTGNTTRKLEWMCLPVWHPDGSLISYENDKPVVMRHDSTKPGLWHVDTLPLPADTWSATPVLRDSQVAFATAKGVTFLDWNTRAVVRETPLTGGPFHVFTHGDGATVFAFAADRRLHRLGVNATSVELPDEFHKPGTLIPTLAFHAGRNLLAVGSNRGVDIFEASATGAPLRHIRTIPADSRITAVGFSPDGRRLGTASNNRELIVWDWEESLPLIQFAVRSSTSNIEFSPDGRWLATTDFSPSVELRDSLPAKK